MHNRLLVPFDFQEQSKINIEWAKFYAEKTNSEIFLLNVIEKAGFLAELFDEDIEQKLKEKAYTKLQGFAQQELKNLKYNIQIRTGKVYEQIEKFADEIKPWAILMGRDENPSLKKHILGSNTLHTISETDIPVISVRGASLPVDISNTIFVPIDFKKQFKEQLTAAIEYAKFFSAKIFIFTVNNDESAAWKTNLLLALNKIRKVIKSNGIDVEIHTETGDIVKNILTYIDKQKPLFTIIMLRDEGIFKGYFIGSVAKNIIENATYPVMSIKPWDIQHDDYTFFKGIIDPLNVF